jgi:hypothetical protein
MKQRTAAGLAWGSFAIGLAITVAALMLLFLSLSARSSSSEYGFRGFGAIFVLSFGGVGAVVASRRPSNPLGWLFCWMGLANAVQLLGQQYEVYGIVAHPGSLPGAIYGAWLLSWLWLPGTVGVLPLLLLFFPDGRLQSTRWRALVWVVLLALPLASANAAFRPGPLENSGLTNPLGLHGAPGRIVASFAIAIIALQVAILPAVAAFVLRVRRATGAERQQLKWLAAAAMFSGLSFVLYFATHSVAPIVKFTEALTIVAIATIPVAIGIAVLRYRLYDIDRIISRTVSYAVVTGLLVGAYAGLVIVFDQATRPITGRSDIAVAASTLIVVALFLPLRRRVRDAVDRRFNRRRYDAANTIEAFTARLRDEVDIDTLTEELREIVSRTMQPGLVSVWLRKPT